ncbi:MAG: hypothetical protein RL750_674 [Bacteroidota bacterium]|jgi:peptidoglycan/xylan/chitin deacetylase (PgdA/CDA1 family)
MRDYWIHSPWWLRKLYPNRVWSIDTKEKIIYLTFDDGPHPQITPVVLNLLHQYNARATFFCIGENVERYPETYQRIKEAGHLVGNHTHKHLNGWKTSTIAYLQDVIEADRSIQSDWFRPPYGRLSISQARGIRDQFPQMKIAMWDVLSGDFDVSKTGEWCAQNVKCHARGGSLVVLHDSEKAWERLKICLPLVLEHFHRQGYRFEHLPGA